MKRWCRVCQTANYEREGAIVYDEYGASMYWICYGCSRSTEVSSAGRVRPLKEVLDEAGSPGVDAALDALKRNTQAKESKADD